jgi:hypothetical protein
MNPTTTQTQAQQIETLKRAVAANTSSYRIGEAFQLIGSLASAVLTFNKIGSDNVFGIDASSALNVLNWGMAGSALQDTKRVAQAAYNIYQGMDLKRFEHAKARIESISPQELDKLPTEVQRAFRLWNLIAVSGNAVSFAVMADTLRTGDYGALGVHKGDLGWMIATILAMAQQGTALVQNAKDVVKGSPRDLIPNLKLNSY